MNSIQKFQDLLRRLFEFEASDLDFGIYRILNYKRSQIEKFIEKDLVDKVEHAFTKHKDERLTNINRRFEEAKEKVIEGLGTKAFTSTGELKEEFKETPLGRDFLSVKAQKDEVEAIDEIKLQVFNDLYNFFFRYYEEGDFVPHYRYSIKGHKYVIPFSGEEVKLYWANSEQYYTKTGLLFRDYTFKAGDYKVIFRIVRAKEELASNKATKERFFVLDDEKPLTLEDKTLIIRFQYRELTEEEVRHYEVEGGSNVSKQEKINQKSYDEVLKKAKDTALKVILGREYKNEKPLLLYHFSRFAAKNMRDYFIHKNLKRFLSEQLDYFIKAEVLDIETLERERFLDKHITRAKVVREIGGDIIDFLSQIEDFQKRLWEKKKFVLKTEYVITTDRVPDEFYDEIWTNKGQRKEWRNLGFEIPKTKEELKDKKLPIDTKYFSIEFKEKLLERLTENADLDDLLDGLLIKSENYQALNLLLSKYKEKVQTIYIDPPFNKEQDADYLYNVKYKDSTWISILENRLRRAKDLMNDRGSIFVRCDYNGNRLVRPLMNEIFREENFRNEITIKRTEGKSRIEGLSYSIATESLFFYAKSDRQFFNIPFRKTDIYSNSGLFLERVKEINQEMCNNLKTMFDEIFWIDLDHRPGERTTSSEIIVFGRRFKAPIGRHWLYSQKRIEEAVQKRKVRIKCKNCGSVYYENPHKCRNCEEHEFKVQIFYDEESLTTNWTDTQSYSQSNFWGIKFPTENSEILLKRVIESTSNEGDWVLDFFLQSAL